MTFVSVCLSVCLAGCQCCAAFCCWRAVKNVTASWRCCPHQSTFSAPKLWRCLCAQVSVPSSIIASFLVSLTTFLPVAISPTPSLCLQSLCLPSHSISLSLSLALSARCSPFFGLILSAKYYLMPPDSWLKQYRLHALHIPHNMLDGCWNWHSNKLLLVTVWTATTQRVNK